MSDAPGGGGYLPCRCMMSGRFTPAAATRTSTSPARGSGTGRSTRRRTSGPPDPAISIAFIEVGMRGMTFALLRRGRRHVIACEPAAQTVESRKEDTLVDVRLIELVPDFPLQFGGNHHAAAERRVLPQPVVHRGRRAGHEREQRELVEDSPIDRRRLHEHEKWTAGQD